MANQPKPQPDDEYSKDDLLGQLWDEVNRLRNRKCGTCRFYSDVDGGIGYCDLHDPYSANYRTSMVYGIEGQLEAEPDFGCNQHELKETDGRKEAEDD